MKVIQEELSWRRRDRTIDELTKVSPTLRTRASQVLLLRLPLHFLFLFLAMLPLINAFGFFWAVGLITLGAGLIDWITQRLLLLPIARLELQKRAERDSVSNL